MESTRLTSYYRSQAAWPKTIAELQASATRLRELLDAPVVAVSLGELGTAASRAKASAEPSAERVADAIRSQFQAAQQLSPPEIGQLRQFQISGSVFESDTGVVCLTFCPIFGTMRADDGTSDRRFLGWLAAVSERALSAKGELLLLAASQHLGSLGSIHHHEIALGLRDQFLSIASHELKTPLTSIYGILQLQERMLRPKKAVPNTPEQEKQRSFFKIVIRQVERLNELIDGLLDVSRIQNGRFMVEPSEADVSVLVQETVQSRLNVIAREAGVKLQLELGDVRTAVVDPVRFEEVVTNLGMNAIRFSPEGGVVWIKLCSQEDGAFVLSVRDQGPAIPEIDRSRIFQPFERAQRTSRLGGLGLGLFISKQIAQLHGGDVALVESIPSKGNLFEARFPIRRAQKISA